uniref:NADH dehydrogenase subunit 6 n=1 Tax=Mutilla europaea TaxID=2749339 RepID=A0A7L7S148_9HYME|nr:NADH dehydrogenase subunit 6 [Mutilla europaea]
MLMMTLTIIMTMYFYKAKFMCYMLIIMIINSTIMVATKIKSSPIPQIMFLTLIGGLMIIFLYLTSITWTHKNHYNYKINPLISYTLVPTIIILPMMIKPLINNKIILLNNNLMMFSVSLFILLTMILVIIIKIHMKANSPFRRKTKMW